MVSPSLTVLVLDEDRIRASIIGAGPREAGHTNVTLLHGATGIARRIADITPDVVVIDLGNPDRDMLENMFQLSRAVRRPIAMSVDHLGGGPASSDRSACRPSPDRAQDSGHYLRWSRRWRESDAKQGRHGEGSGSTGVVATA